MMKERAMNTNEIWTSLAETGKAYGFINDTLWGQLLDEALEEGVTLECRLLADGVNAVYLRRARV